MCISFPLIGCLATLNPKICNFVQFSTKSSSLPNPKVQIDLFLLWVLITYRPGMYMPNMEINCCSFCKARVFRGLLVSARYVMSDFDRYSSVTEMLSVGKSKE